jgi:hypothetical protein
MNFILLPLSFYAAFTARARFSFSDHRAIELEQTGDDLVDFFTRHRAGRKTGFAGIRRVKFSTRSF